MHLFKFKHHKFRDSTIKRIEECNKVLKDLVGQGYHVTLRQLYYQLVSENKIKNEVREYKRLVNLMTKAREAGMVDWRHIYDFTRELVGYYMNDDPEQAISDAARTYNIDLWHGQENYVEVWVEKDALKDVISKPSKRWQVPYFSCRGYTSTSAMYNAFRRLERIRNERGMNTIIIHVGDHDPSGIQMSEDIFERHNNLFTGSVEVDRIALNLDQVQERQLPPNPAKQTDSRYTAYCTRFGVEDSWELDALKPKELDEMIGSRIEHYCDVDKFEDRKTQHEEEREQLYEFSDNYDLLVRVLKNPTDVEDLMNDNGL